MDTIGIIGIGNMGSALIKGMLQNQVIPPNQILTYDIDAMKNSQFASDNSVTAVNDLQSLITDADIIILAVKPDIAPNVLRTITPHLNKEKTLLSIVLGVKLETLAELTNNQAKYIRCMPNTPALVNEGMICISFGDGFDDTERTFIEKLFLAVGKVEILPEKHLNAITALTGSSPAYVFVFIEAMADAAVLSGIPRNIAYKLAAQSVLGSAKLVLETQKHPGELKDNVCSPAGSTIEAIRSLEKNGFRSAVIEAMIACNEKAYEISNKKG